jgi:hypothetical protein
MWETTQETRGLFRSGSDWQGEADALKLEHLALTSLPEDASAPSGGMEARHPSPTVTLAVEAALWPAASSQPIPRVRPAD